MAKSSSALTVVSPHRIDLVPFESAQEATTKEERRATNEEALQTRVIAGERRKIEQAIGAVASIQRRLHSEWGQLADEVVAIQREEHDPAAQRWIDWFTEQAMPQAGSDLARIGHTGAHTIGTVVAQSLYPSPEPPRPLSLVEKVVGRRRED